METIREWASKIPEKQRGNFSGQLTDELLKLIKAELLMVTPDYEGCILALTTLHHQSMAVFYERIYPQVSNIAQESINTALLNYANMRPGKAACSRIAQAIQQRLKNGESAEVLVPELKWYTGNTSEKNMQNNFKNIWSGCDSKNLLKLFELDLTGWQVDKLKLQNFYFCLFQMLRTADGKTDWNSIFTTFLAKNHLNGPESNNLLASSMHSADQQYAPTPHISVENTLPVTQLLSEVTFPVPVQSVTHDKTSDKSVDKTESEVRNTIGKSTTEEGNESVAIAYNDHSILNSEISQAESGLAKDGIKLAELLLAWSRKQVGSTSSLKESLRMSEREYKRLDTQFSNLRDELFSVKKELAGRNVEIASLQRQLAEAAAHLDSVQKHAAESDETIRKLQRMNENSASQAVLGYKTELAAALKSIVEDASLPEAQKDADILSALLEDLLDVLRFKGVPLEGR